MTELENTIRQIAEPFVETLGLEIWGIEISQFHRTVIRIYVDRPSTDSISADKSCTDNTCTDNTSTDKTCMDKSSTDNSCADKDSKDSPNADSHSAMHGDDVASAGLELSPAAKDQENEARQNELQSDDTPLSVGIDQCARISRHIGLVLEVEDVIVEAYVLEVSSPGLSRQFFKLNQLHQYINDSMEVVLRQGHEEWENRRKFTGILQKVTDTGICLSLADLDKPKNGKENLSLDRDIATKIVPIEWEEIRIIKRVHSFNKAKATKKKK